MPTLLPPCHVWLSTLLLMPFPITDNLSGCTKFTHITAVNIIVL